MQKVYLKAIGLGAIAGMRSMSAPAFVSGHLVEKGTSASASWVLRSMSSPNAALAFKLAAAGEIFADKLPIIPDRISPGPLAARIASGAVCGSSICESEGKRSDLGAAAGALAAVGSAFVFYHIRRRITESRIIPDAIVALAEDAVVLTAGSITLGSQS